MRLPIDTSGMTSLCAQGPAPVNDPETRHQKADKRTGELLWGVQLVALTDEGAEILRVLVPSECKGVTQAQPVKVAGLIANYWQMDDRHGVSFRATKVEPVAATTTGNGSTASASASSSGSSSKAA